MKLNKILEGIFEHLVVLVLLTMSLFWILTVSNKDGENYLRDF